MQKKHTDSQHGLTLIELLIVIAIVSILASISIPSMLDIIKNNKTRELLSEFVSALQLTQSEAITRGITVSIAPMSESSGEWKTGWTIFTDPNSNGKMDTNETLIGTYQRPSGNLTLVSKNSDFSSSLTFLPLGMPKEEITGTFQICQSDQDTSTSRTIKVQPSGNILAKIGSLSCP